MNEAQQSPDDQRSPVVSLVQWLAVVGVTFFALGFSMNWVAQTIDVPSPVSIDSAGGGSAVGLYPAPDFRLASLDGGMIGPMDFPGQVVLVELWATWCGPCRAQARILEDLHREFPDVQFLAVDSGEDEATVRSYVQATPFPYPVLLDPQDTVSMKYRVNGLPTVFIVNRDGQISFMETGVSSGPTLRRELQAAGAGQVPETTV